MHMTVSAIHDNGLNDKSVLNITLDCDITKYPDFDPEKAIKDATADFLRTDRGKAILKETSGSFNYGDFINYVPDTFCRKYGFTIWGTGIANTVVDQNENLIP